MSDSEDFLQDVVRCYLCETSIPLLHCEMCNISLCEECEKKHVLDDSKEHTIVNFKSRRSTPKCQKHLLKMCKFYCEQCDIPICDKCVSIGEHDKHNINDILKHYGSKINVLEKDLEELEKSIHPAYKNIAFDISVQKANIVKNSQKLKSAIINHAEDWHREIDSIVNKLKADLDVMDSKYLDDLQKEEDEIKSSISEIIKIIDYAKNLISSNNISLVSDYHSRNAKLKQLLPKLVVFLPNFSPHVINREDINQQFGSLSSLSIKTKEHGNTVDSQGSESFLEMFKKIDALIVTVIETEYKSPKLGRLYSVCCLSDSEVWTCGYDNKIRLYNQRGEQVKAIATKSGNMPWDIVVTGNLDLVYVDYNNKTVNMVNNKYDIEIIRTHGWKPRSVCCASSGDLLVVIESDDDQKRKIVRYHTGIEKQTIQFNDEGQPLFSSGVFPIHIIENRNQDICVSDFIARKVVVVNQAGKLRFTYSGPSNNRSELFNPYGITADSQCRILTVDNHSNFIHIIDQDGQFLCYIDNCYVDNPWGACVDTRDNLYVAENCTCKVKKIKYYL